MRASSRFLKCEAIVYNSGTFQRRNISLSLQRYSFINTFPYNYENSVLQTGFMAKKRVAPFTCAVQQRSYVYDVKVAPAPEQKTAWIIVANSSYAKVLKTIVKNLDPLEDKKQHLHLLEINEKLHHNNHEKNSKNNEKENEKNEKVKREEAREEAKGGALEDEWQRETLTEIDELHHHESRLKESELARDKRGRSFDRRGEGRHGVEPHHLRKEVEANVFAKQLAHYIEDARTKGHVDKVYLASSPHFLGLLRHEISKPTVSQHFIGGEINKDLTHLSIEVIRTYFPRHLVDFEQDGHVVGVEKLHP